MRLNLSLALLLLPLAACELQGLPADKLLVDDTSEDLDDSGNDSDSEDPDDTDDTEDTEDTEDSDTSPPDPVDEDHDGFDTETDCDDTDASVHPGAQETDDNVDQDCDGVIDEKLVCESDLADYDTIAQAISAASSGDTIEICAGLYTENLSVNKAITLWAPEGPEKTIVDGGAAGITLSVSNMRESRITIDGLQLTNGVSSDWGGGLRCTSANLDLKNVIVSESTGPSGGGLGAYRCDVAIESSLFTGNLATATDESGYGGGLFLYECTGSVGTSDIFSNEGANGGGLFVYDTTGGVTIDNNTFQGNHVFVPKGQETSYGGGFYIYGNTPLTNNLIDANAADYSAGGGYILYGSGEVRGNTVSGNTCGNDGAGIYISQGSNTIAENVFEYNASSDDAGGLRVYVSQTVVENNTFTGNTANDDGGGVKLSHYRNTIRNNIFDGNSAGDAGGGLEFDNETSTLQDCVFYNNTAYRGAGVHAWRNEGRTGIIETSEFYDNTATDCGGAVQLDNLSYNFTLRNLDIHNNNAGDGAAVCVDLFWWDADDDDVVDTWISSTATFENLLIYDNDASDNAGAIYVKAGAVTIVNCTMDENTGNAGSAIVAKYENDLEEDAAASATIINSIITNHGPDEALLVEDATITMSYSSLYGNEGNVSGLDDPVGTSNNIGIDPLYTDDDSDDLTLQSTSPCVNTGNPARAYNDVDGTRADMGAYGGPYSVWD